MLFGTAYEYWSREWKCDYPATVKKVSKLGFDVLEIGADHLYHMSDHDIDTLRRQGEECGIVFTTNSGPGKEYDLASSDVSIRQNGINYFTKTMQNMNKLGSKSLVGAIYSNWPCDFSETDKEAAWERSIACLKTLAVTAEELDVVISLEVLNRYETYILTDCAEAVDYVKRIGSRNIDILLDTYHMNIEEDNMYDAIRYAGSLLGHLHVGECNRKLPGQNHSIDWMKIGKALREIHYQKAVVMEPFLLSGGAVGRDIKVWRDLSGNATIEQMDEMLKEALVYLKKCCLGEEGA